MIKKFLDINNFFPYPIMTDRYMIGKSIFKYEDLEYVKCNWSEYRKERYLSSFVIGKEYTILYDRLLEKTMMSNHEFEMMTNQKFLDSAKGDVLIFGLGIGLIIHPLLNDSDINTIDVDD